MPVELRFGNGARDTTVVVQHTASGQLFRVRLPFAPSSVQLDPDKKILREVLTPDQLPVAFGLEQNYPNPFNPGTSIPVTLPRRADVSLIVYDLLGREVAVIFRGRVDPGSMTLRWDGRDTNGRPAATGVYFCRMTAGDFTATRRMILMR